MFSLEEQGQTNSSSSRAVTGRDVLITLQSKLCQSQSMYRKVKRMGKPLGRALEVSTAGVLAWLSRQQRFIAVVPKSGCILETPEELLKKNQ